MDKEKLKRIKVVYYPYKAAKNVVLGPMYYFKYLCALRNIETNTKRVQEKIKNKEILNVVFIVQYIPGWNKLEPIYTKMKQDNRFAPIILCVPLNIQNHKLMDNQGNDTYDYFVNHGYDAIDSLQNNTWYDLKQLKPDYVFHSRPYNYFMPQEYTSGKIVKYALICNVMYGASFSKNDEKIAINKDFFRDVCIYFATCKEDILFLNKICNWGCKFGVQKQYLCGLTGLEQIVAVSHKKVVSQYTKTIIWTPRWSTNSEIGGSNFFKYKDFMLDLAKCYQDFLFVFRPHPLMFSNFIKTGEMNEQQVQGFKNYCENESNIELDEKEEYFDLFWNSDLLICDPSGIVPEYMMTGKPIIYCHTNADFEYLDYYKEIINNSYEAFERDDILRIFTKIANNDDYKENDRIRLLKDKYSTVENQSSRIIHILSKEEE